VESAAVPWQCATVNRGYRTASRMPQMWVPRNLRSKPRRFLASQGDRRHRRSTIHDLDRRVHEISLTRTLRFCSVHDGTVGVSIVTAVVAARSVPGLRSLSLRVMNSSCQDPILRRVHLRRATCLSRRSSRRLRPDLNLRRKRAHSFAAPLNFFRCARLERRSVPLPYLKAFLAHREFMMSSMYPRPMNEAGAAL